MASMGLAWYQGQKNAQDAARGQVGTVLDMARNAAEADRQMEYFSPVQQAVRARQTKGTSEKLQKLQEIDLLKNRMSTDPYGVTKELLSRKYGGEWMIAKTKDGIVARPAVPEGVDLSSPEGRSLYANTRVINLGNSPEQMLSTVIGEYVSTTEESIADKMTKSNAQISKALEIEKDTMKALGQEQAKAAYLYPHQERVENIKGRYGLAGTGMTNASQERQAYIQKTLGADKMPEVIKQNLALKGIVVDDKNNVTVRVIGADNKPMSVDLQSLPQDQYEQVQAQIRAVQGYTAEAPRANRSPSSPVPIQRPAGLPSSPVINLTPDPTVSLSIQGDTFRDPRTGLRRPISELPMSAKPVLESYQEDIYAGTNY